MRLARASVGALVLAVVAACGGPGSGLIGISDDDGPGNGGGNGSPNPASATIQVVNFAFAPAVVTIRPGGSVTWVWNSDTTSHNVTFSTTAFNSPTRNSGTHVVRFAAAGTFVFRCTIHGDENGAVMVQ
jgi:plastocyanin